MIEHLMAEYGLSRREAWERFPLPAALVMLPASLERRGREPAGPGAEMMAFLQAVRPPQP